MYYLTDEHYEIAKENGITKKHLENRVYSKAWTIERAISEPLKRRSNHNWDAKWSKVAIVPKVRFMKRVQNGWDQERAAMTPIINQSELMKERNKAIRTFSDEQEKKRIKNNIPLQTAYLRVKKLNWSKEDAVTRPVMSVEERTAAARAHQRKDRLVFGKNRKRA